ncbi:AgmX/PglI C-terminal domain-containing protein [Myxococcota bacterium]|nr:AgmX/PglI C-terminal domain-containing protein [Myxococcota bacterium]
MWLLRRSESYRALDIEVKSDYQRRALSIVRSAVFVTIALSCAPSCATAPGDGAARGASAVATKPAPARVEPAAPKRTPEELREEELLELLGGAKLRGRSPAEQSLARALALQELAALRHRRGDHDAEESSIEIAVREARASGDANVATKMLAERFRITRQHATERADRGDFAGALKKLDALALVAELSAEQRRTLQGDRLVVMERREEAAQKSGGGLGIPGEPEALDTSAVLAEMERVFGPDSSFARPELDPEQEREILKSLGFALASTTDGASPTMEIVSAPVVEEPKTPSSATRGHDLPSSDRVTVDLPSRSETALAKPVLDDDPDLPRAALPKASDAPLVETGYFDQRTVVAMVSLHRGAVTRCYERSLRAGEQLSGKLEVKITVQPTGVVSLTEVTSKSHAASELARCVQTTIGRWRFPPFAGKESSVTIPFFLKGAT